MGVGLGVGWLRGACVVGCVEMRRLEWACGVSGVLVGFLVVGVLCVRFGGAGVSWTGGGVGGLVMLWLVFPVLALVVLGCCCGWMVLETWLCPWVGWFSLWNTAVCGLDVVPCGWRGVEEGLECARGGWWRRLFVVGGVLGFVGNG